MKKYLLASALCIGAAFASLTFAAAQTPTPAPSPSPSPATSNGTLFNDSTQPNAVRIEDGALYLPTINDPVKLEAATFTYDYLLFLAAHQWADIQTLSESLIANGGAYYSGPATPGYTQGKQDQLYCWAVQWKARYAFTKTDDQVAFLLSIFDALPATASDQRVSAVNGFYLYYTRQKTLDLIRSGDYTNALANALQPQLLNSADQVEPTYKDILKIKTLTHASDVLSWAKAVYVMSSFADSARVSVLVANGFRANTGLADANTFLASQTDATISSPLDSVPYPGTLTGGTLPEPRYAGVNILLRAGPKAALTYARTQYDAATTNDDLNAQASNVAAALRNYYYNLVRANAFVASNHAPAAGQPTPAPFEFTELQ